GTLMSDGLHILTAAHVANNTAAKRVVFDLAPTAAGRNVPPISINVPVGPGYQIPLGGFVSTNRGNDLSILRLTDQVAPASANRLLVAPYYGPQIGYPLVPDGNSDLGNPFTVVGYGLTGTGPTGMRPGTARIKRMGVNTSDADANILNNEVQTVGLTGTPTGGFFQLTYRPLGGGAVTTGNIPWNATAAQVQAALTALAPLAGNVIVNGGWN